MKKKMNTSTETPTNQPAVMVSIKMSPETLHALRIKAGQKNLPGVSTFIRELIETELSKG